MGCQMKTLILIIVLWYFYRKVKGMEDYDKNMPEIGGDEDDETMSKML